MSSIDWKPGLTIPMDPDDVTDYEFDFAAWLDGDSISTIDAIAVGCTAAVTSNDLTSAILRVSAVVAGANVTMRALRVTGQRKDFTVNFPPLES